ncbi:hypothetical protein [Parvularcula dongshanensis]|uniref:VPLPA-CTERM sorting domain-containing protein n=1 Tax=Parvularcula dongshanensis TaxID=1173995 RepID=A0A840I5T9_9PROT|nr:hypothetical protein [Parvularcula dongshanensis]MBB4659554.1 hypothetical protein [Parvularcula dongshanensis]
MRRILLTTSLLALLPTAAAAQCEDFGGVVLCSGVDEDGFATENSIYLEVESDGEVRSLDGEDALALTGPATQVVVGAGASVSGSDDGIDFGQAEDGVLGDRLVQNDGAISGGDKAIDADGLEFVTVINTGTITSGDKGIRVGTGDDAYLENYGTISAGDEAFEAGDRAFVFNDAGAVIETTDEDAIQVGADAEILNFGSILSGTGSGDGIDVDGGTIINFEGASIVSRGFASDPADAEAGIDVDEGSATLEVVNLGLIEGQIGILTDPGNDGSQLIENQATIRGTGGIALDLGAGEDGLVLNTLDAVLEGDALFGLGDDLITLIGDQRAFVGSLGGGDDFTLFDGGTGDDTIALDSLVTLDDVGMIVASSMLAGAFELDFTNADGSSSLLLFTSFENFLIGGELFAFGDLSEIPLPAAAPLFAGALGLGGMLRRRRRKA